MQYILIREGVLGTRWLCIMLLVTVLQAIDSKLFRFAEAGSGCLKAMTEEHFAMLVPEGV